MLLSIFFLQSCLTTLDEWRLRGAQWEDSPIAIRGSGKGDRL
ncbi:hypothetical protein [Scytonema sp. HK-05]|nr:hypothetical protein [Scytonema sp. HK-05]